MGNNFLKNIHEANSRMLLSLTRTDIALAHNMSS
jgi:hypothetical protein